MRRISKALKSLQHVKMMEITDELYQKNPAPKWDRDAEKEIISRLCLEPLLFKGGAVFSDNTPQTVESIAELFQALAETSVTPNAFGIVLTVPPDISALKLSNTQRDTVISRARALDCKFPCATRF
jgi:hypothetical protein